MVAFVGSFRLGAGRSSARVLSSAARSSSWTGGQQMNRTRGVVVSTRVQMASDKVEVSISGFK